MKNSILLIICFVTAVFFSSINKVEAQWCFYVTYEDSECNCGNIDSEKLSYSIYDLVLDEYVVNLTTIDLPSGTITLQGTETILWDEQDRYLVYARITYYDPTVCCGGWDSYIADGDKLTQCEITLTIIMD
jgi:hypothetical protein